MTPMDVSLKCEMGRLVRSQFSAAHQHRERESEELARSWFWHADGGNAATSEKNCA